MQTNPQRQEAGQQLPGFRAGRMDGLQMGTRKSGG